MEETLIGKYKILEEIGRGGMGVVYRGEQVSLKRLVAIKTLPLELAHDQEYLERIENEAEILAKFSHPCIVYIHEMEKQADAVYLIMEYVPGITVAERIRKEGPYEIKEAVRIIIRVASALDHAHKKGIIHRDIKPSNIMIREDNSVKVTDFGIAKSSEGSDITRLRWTPGTRDYMSPEQAQGYKDLDGRSDIYSLGIVFYLMMTGKLPPFPLPARLPFVPPRYEKIILKCLAEDRSERYPTASDLIMVLEDAEKKYAGSVKGKKPGRSPQKNIALIAGGLGTALLFVLLIWNLDHIANYVQIVIVKIAGEELPSKKDLPSSALYPIAKEDTQSVKPKPIGPTAEKRPLQEPVLRTGIDRNQDILNEMRSLQGNIDQGAVRRIFALRIGLIERTGQNPGLLSSIISSLEKMETVKSVNYDVCDLLFFMDSNLQGTTVTISSNLYGDDKRDTYQESFSFSDDQQLFSSLAAIICRYYCFNILRSIELLKPAVDGYAIALTINGGAKGMFQVGENIKICMSSKRKAYSMIFSAGAEGLYLLSPRTREEHVPLNAGKPFCSEPLQVSPPTGSELVAAILLADKTLLPLDRYLASDDQVIVEPASWPYDMFVADNALEYCEKLVTTLYKVPPEKWSAKSQFIKTYN